MVVCRRAFTHHQGRLSQARLLCPRKSGSVVKLSSVATSSCAGLLHRRFYSKSSSNGPTYGFVFDVDGVLVQSTGPKTYDPIKGAGDALRLLESKRVPFALLSNGGGVLEAHKAEQLSHVLDFELKEEQIILSHTPMKTLSERYCDSTVLVVGKEETPEVAVSYGFNNVVSIGDVLQQFPTIYPTQHLYSVPPASKVDIRARPIEVVMVMADPLDFGCALQILCDVAQSAGVPGRTVSSQRLPFYFSNPDFLWGAKFSQPRFGQGAFRRALSLVYRDLTGHELSFTEFGKPNKAPYDYAKKLFQGPVGNGANVQTYYAVGDNPVADIRGANSAGPEWVSILTRTGVYCGKQTFSAKLDVPKMTFDSVWEAVKAVVDDEEAR